MRLVAAKARSRLASSTALWPTRCSRSRRRAPRSSPTSSGPPSPASGRRSQATTLACVTAQAALEPHLRLRPATPRSMRSAAVTGRRCSSHLRHSSARSASSTCRRSRWRRARQRSMLGTAAAIRLHRLLHLGRRWPRQRSKRSAAVALPCQAQRPHLRAGLCPRLQTRFSARPFPILGCQGARLPRQLSQPQLPLH